MSFPISVDLFPKLGKTPHLMLRNLFLILISINAFAQGAKTPRFDLDVQTVCADAVAAFRQPVPGEYLNQLVEEGLFAQFTFFEKSHPNYENFRGVARGFFAALMAEGMRARSAMLSTAVSTEAAAQLGMTPTQYSQRLYAARESAKPLALPTGSPHAVIAPEALNVQTQNPLLLDTIRIFKRTGLKFRAISELTSSQYQGELLAELLNDLPPEIDFSPEDARKVLKNSVGGSLPLPSFYAPQGQPRGILFPAYLVPGMVPDWAMHEMAHVAQDVSWDLRILLGDYVRSGLREQVRAEDFPLSDEERALLDLRTQRFLKFTLDPAHRREVFIYARKMGLSMREWGFFLDYFLFLTELDAYRQGSLLAEEHGRLGTIFQPENLYGHIVAMYVVEQPSISAHFLKINIPESFLVERVNYLNQTRRFRQSAYEWATEWFFWARGRGRELNRQMPSLD